jgi:hypothetical protein
MLVESGMIHNSITVGHDDFRNKKEGFGLGLSTYYDGINEYMAIIPPTRARSRAPRVHLISHHTNERNRPRPQEIPRGWLALVLQVKVVEVLIGSQAFADIPIAEKQNYYSKRLA